MPFGQRFIGFRKDFSALAYDATRAMREATFTPLGRALAIVVLLVLLAVPGAVLVVGDEAFGDKWAFGLAFGLWPVLLEAPGWWLRREEAAHLAGLPAPAGNPGFDTFAFAALTALSVVVEVVVAYLVVGDVAGTSDVGRGVLWGVGLSGALDIARTCVALFLAGLGGYPLYR